MTRRRNPVELEEHHGLFHWRGDGNYRLADMVKEYKRPADADRAARRAYDADNRSDLVARTVYGTRGNPDDEKRATLVSASRYAPKYDAAAVQRAIESSSRHGPKISGKEAKLIHALLKGRHGNPGKLAAYEKALGGRIRQREGSLPKGVQRLAHRVSHALLTGTDLEITTAAAEHLYHALERAGHPHVAGQWMTFVEGMTGSGARRNPEDEREVRVSHTVPTLGPKETAAAIRKILKKAFPGTTFSTVTERGSMVSSVRVSYVDGPTRKRVHALVDGFEAGHFDGMTDSYEYDRTRVLEVNGTVYRPGTRYVFVERRLSPRATLRAFDAVLAKRYSWGTEEDDARVVSLRKQLAENMNDKGINALYAEAWNLYPGGSRQGRSLAQMIHAMAEDRTALT